MRSELVVDLEKLQAGTSTSPEPTGKQYSVQDGRPMLV